MIDAEKNGETVLATKFWEKVKAQKDPSAWLRANRGGFICPVCKAPATFVSPGRGHRGTPTHFRVAGASQCNNHGPSTKADGGTGRAPELREGIINVGGVVTLLYENLGAAVGRSGSLGGTGDDGGRTGRVRYFDGGGAPNNHESALLRAFLSDLWYMPDYPPQDLRLKVAERGEIWGTDYFRRFADATAEDAKPLPETGQPRLMAYWGEIEKPNDTGSLFLEGGGMSVMLLPKHKHIVRKELGISNFEDLKGWVVIAEGRLEDGFGNLYVRVPDLSKVAFIKP